MRRVWAEPTYREEVKCCWVFETISDFFPKGVDRAMEQVLSMNVTNGEMNRGCA